MLLIITNVNAQKSIITWQTDTSGCIIVSPIQFEAKLKKDSIMNSNKVKPKVSKLYVRNYHGPKNFITPINFIPVEKSKKEIKPKKSYYPFFNETNYTHNINIFNVPVAISTSEINITPKLTPEEIQKQKDAKALEIQKQKDAKTLEIQKQRNFKEKKNILAKNKTERKKINLQKQKQKKINDRKKLQEK